MFMGTQLPSENETNKNKQKTKQNKTKQKQKQKQKRKQKQKTKNKKQKTKNKTKQNKKNHAKYPGIIIWRKHIFLYFEVEAPKQINLIMFMDRSVKFSAKKR